MGRLTSEDRQKIKELATMPSAVGSALTTGLRYWDRAARLGGLGVGTIGGGVLKAILDPMEATAVGRWLPDVSQLPESAKAFWDVSRTGDWDAAIEAYQDPMEAGPGFWGASELAGELLIPGGLAKAGTRLTAKALPMAQTLGKAVPARIRPAAVSGIEAGLRGTGQAMRVPWEVEEAVGRGIAYPFRKGAQAFRQAAIAPNVAYAAPAVSGDAIIPGGKFKHFTTPEAKAQLEAGSSFDSTLLPQHGTGDLSLGPKTGKFAGDRLYLSLDDQRWSKVHERRTAGEMVESTLANDGIGGSSFFDYDKQKWMKFLDEDVVTTLSPVEYQISPTARILEIDSYEAYGRVRAQYGNLIDDPGAPGRSSAWDKIARDYDAVVVRNREKILRQGDDPGTGRGHKFYRAIGGDQVIVLNPRVATVVKSTPLSTAPAAPVAREVGERVDVVDDLTPQQVVDADEIIGTPPPATAEEVAEGLKGLPGRTEVEIGGQRAVTGEPRVTGAVAGERNVQDTLDELNRLNVEAVEAQETILKADRARGSRLLGVYDPLEKNIKVGVTEGFAPIPKIMGKLVRNQELTPDELSLWNRYKGVLAKPEGETQRLRKQQIDIVEEAQAFEARRTTTTTRVTGEAAEEAITPVVRGTGKLAALEARASQMQDELSTMTDVAMASGGARSGASMDDLVNLFGELQKVKKEISEITGLPETKIDLSGKWSQPKVAKEAITPPAPVTPSIIENMAEELAKAENTLKLAKRSRGRDRLERITAAQDEVDDLNLLRERTLEAELSPDEWQQYQDLLQKQDEIITELQVMAETKPTKAPHFGSRERIEWDEARKRAGTLPGATGRRRARLKSELETINSEIDEIRKVPEAPEGVAAAPKAPVVPVAPATATGRKIITEAAQEAPQQQLAPEFASEYAQDFIDDIVANDGAEDFLKKADPGGGGRGPDDPGTTAGGMGPDEPSPLDQIRKEIAEVATPGETEIETLLRRHEGAVTSAINDADIAVRAGEKKLRALGITVGRGGREVVKESALPQMDQLRAALHGEGPVPAGLEDVYNELRRFTDWEQTFRIDFNPAKARVKDYFYRGWKMSDEMAADVENMPGAMGWPPKYAKPRNKLTYKEMRKLGFEPLSWNPYEQWLISHKMRVRYDQQNMLIEQMKKLEIAQPYNAGPIKKGYRIPQVGPAFEGKPSAVLDASGESVKILKGAWVVPDDAARRLENVYGKMPSLGKIGVRGKEIDILKVIDALTFVPKRAKLMFSFFQQYDFLSRSLVGSWSRMVDELIAGFRTKDPKRAIKSVKHLAEWPASARDILKANFNPGFRSSLKKQLASTTPLIEGRPGVHLKGIMEAGLSVRDVTIFPNDIGDIARSVAEEGGGLLGYSKKVASLISQVESAMRRGLFDGVYPAAQITDIKNNIAEMIVRQYPKATDAQINGMIARITNTKYSTIPASQSIFQNQALRAFLQRVFFSIGESEGLLRQATQAFTGPYASYWQKHWLAAYLSFMSTAVVIHGISTGKPLPSERWVPLSKDNWGSNVLGYTRDFAAPTLPFKGRGGTQITLDLVGQLDTVFRILDPKSFISSRHSVPVRAALNQIKGTDFFGAPIDEVGPGGIYSRTAALINDVFSPIGVGQAATGIAREVIPGVGKLLPPGEERLGWAQLLQAPGLNVRAETTPMLLDRMARESNLRIEGTENPRFGQPAQRWDDLSPGQKRQIQQQPETEKELRFRTETGARQGTAGAVTRQKTEVLKAETVEVLNDISENYLSEPIGSGKYNPIDAREALGEELNVYYGRLDEIYKETGEGEEPAKNTIDHHLWRYRNIFADLRDSKGKITDWDAFAEEEAKFWGSMPVRDVRSVVNSMHALEGDYPEPLRRLSEAKRYTGAFTVALDGVQYSYWDVPKHPDVERDIAERSFGSVTPEGLRQVRAYLDKTYGARQAAQEIQAGRDMERGLASSDRTGELGKKRKEFLATVPTSWKAAMYEAGYQYKGIGTMRKKLGAVIGSGEYSWTKYPYEELYIQALEEK